MNTRPVRLSAWLLAAPALKACDAGREPPPVEETVFEGPADALDRAADVQRVTDEREGQLRRAVEHAEGE